MTANPELLPTKFTKKPVTIEAFQLTEEVAVASMVDNKSIPFGLTVSGSFNPLTRAAWFYYININTLEGTMTASQNDWIIKGIKGELYPCKPDIFEATYTRTEAPATQAEVGVLHELLEFAARNHRNYRQSAVETDNGVYHGAANAYEVMEGVIQEKIDEAPTATGALTERIEGLIEPSNEDIFACPESVQEYIRNLHAVLELSKGDA